MLIVYMYFFQIETEGAKSLTKLFSSKSKLHSLNVSSNNIGKCNVVVCTTVI